MQSPDTTTIDVALEGLDEGNGVLKHWPTRCFSSCSEPLERLVTRPTIDPKRVLPILRSRGYRIVTLSELARLRP